MTNSGKERRKLSATWQLQQIGRCDRSVSGISSASNSDHSCVVPSIAMRAGRRACQSMTPTEAPQRMHRLPRYHSARSARTRHPCGALSIWRKQSSPQPARSGQREQDRRRNLGLPRHSSMAACQASTATPAGVRVSGHVTTRAPRKPRYLRKTSIEKNTPAPKANVTIAPSTRFTVRTFRGIGPKTGSSKSRCLLMPHCLCHTRLPSLAASPDALRLALLMSTTRLAWRSSSNENVCSGVSVGHCANGLGRSVAKESQKCR